MKLGTIIVLVSFFLLELLLRKNSPAFTGAYGCR